MTRHRALLIIGAVLVAALAGAAAGMAGASSSGPPAASDPTVPQQPPDLGIGERLVLVIGGSFSTREEAVRANEGITFGELQGYYVARTDQFEGLDKELGTGDDYVLVTAFRTQTGVLEFLEMANAAGAPAAVTGRLLNRGPDYVGLGQEPAPDGSGPLTHPIEASTTD